MARRKLQSPLPPAPSEGEMLYGTKAIAAFLGVHERQALTMAEAGRIPTFRAGKVICARRRRLLEWLDQQEAQADAEAAK